MTAWRRLLCGRQGRYAIWPVLLLLAACSSDQRRAPPPVVNETPPLAASGSYLVQPGDTIYSVARELHMSLRALIDANQLQAPYLLQPGRRLTLPGSGFYLVAKGDTLSGIAKKTGVPFATLARTNGLSAPYVLQVGQKLQMPGGDTQTATVVPPLATTAALPPVAPLAAQPPVAVTTTALPPPPAGATATPAPAAAAAAPVPAPLSTAVPAATTVAVIPPPLPPPPAKSEHGFVWPVKGEVIAEFGTTGKGQHSDGINIAAPRGASVVAAESGVVAYSGNELRGFGNLLLIKHEDGWMTAYAHNDALLVKRGEVVKRGQKIATVGDSGGVSQPQLHFELRQGTRAIDPMPVLEGKPLPTAASSESG
jgi:murein DD-endopeptidase MepM/ murein hydrolase activator NlpD